MPAGTAWRSTHGFVRPTKATPAPERTLRYTSCNDVWAGGPFKEGEPGYAEQPHPDGIGTACEFRPK